jgi:acylphosphatase
VVRKRVIVLGEVQGVFFRDTCQRAAVDCRVSGWVRNLPDGTVEAVFEGEPDSVDGMVAWAHRGPARARVHSVEVYDEDPAGVTGFTIARSPWRVPRRR